RTRPLFDAHRQAAAAAGKPHDPDKFAYLALVAVGHSKEEGFRRADQIVDYIRNSGRVAPQFVNPPGYASNEMNVRALKSAGPTGHQTVVTSVTTRSGAKITKDDFTVENLIDAGILFAGDPDMVYRQIE